MSRRGWGAVAGLVASGLMAGCTIGGVPSKPGLGTTTSAEQVQRIFWQDVKDQKWLAVQGLLVANVTWRNGRDVLTREQVVPYLQKLQIKDFVITNVVVKANANDMTVVYDLQVTTGGSGTPENLHGVAVWQQVPFPPDHASKKDKKAFDAASPYLLTVEDLAPDSGVGGN